MTVDYCKRTMKRPALMLSFLMIASCDQPAKPAPDRLPEVVKLQAQVAVLTSRLDALEQLSKASADAQSSLRPSSAELELSDGGRASTVAYPDMDACKAAQEAALAENVRRAESYKVQNIIVGPMVSAYCIPR